MSSYGPYAGASDQAPNGDGSYQQPQGQQRNPQFRPPIAPHPSGYQQTPNPQNYGSPSLDGQRYGGLTPNTNASFGQPSPSYFPPQGQQGGGSPQGPMGSLTSHMGGLDVSGDTPPATRSGKRRNRHAYHNIEQSAVASEAFNQSMGNAPQYINQEASESLRPHTGGQSASSMNAFNPQPGPFSPGFQSSNQGTPNQNLQPPMSRGTEVSAQGRVDPEQIPSIPRQRDVAASYYLDHIYPTMEMQIPPPGAIPFVAQDQGNSSPKFARLTLNNIPASSDALTQTGLPLGLFLQPLARLQAGEKPVPVLDFGDIGPPRCRRCRAYINPFMIFRSGGNKFVCNMCTFPNDVSPEYFAPADMSGVRVDRAQRPELMTGTVEYLVPKEYWAKEPVGLRWLFLLDVSQDAVEKGYVKAICQGISSALYGENEEFTGEESPDEENSTANRSIPSGAKVGFVTFDKAVYYYNCHVCSSCVELGIRG